MNKVFANLLSNIFSPFCGIVFAVNIGLNLPYEQELYWIEHYLGAIVNPLALIIGGRYRSRRYFDFSYQIIGYAYFSLYHRFFLFPVSLLTWANLDQILCHSETDPFYHLLGTWYYMFADTYVLPASLIISYGYLIFSEVIYFVKDKLTGNNKVKGE